MKLFLAAEAKHPQSLQKLEEFAGGFHGKKIAYVPTAANGYRWELWKEGESWPLVHTLGADVTLTLLEDFLTEDPIQKIQSSDIVWFAGGMPGYLMYWIRRTKLNTKIREILEKTIYVGSSAGSMVAGSSLEIGEWYPGDEEPGASAIPTLQLVPFDIFPHFEEEMMPVIRGNYKGEKLYMLKNGEAVIVEDKKITISGEERILER